MFDEFHKKYKPEKTLYISRYNPRPVYATSGFILNTSFGGCTSVGIVNMNDNMRVGASTHCQPTDLNELLGDIDFLISKQPPLINATDLVLLWNKLNTYSRFNKNGVVYRFRSQLESIFKGADIRDFSYPGHLDAYGIYIDEGILVLPQKLD